MTLSLVPAGATQSDAVIQGDVITDLCGLTDDHTHTVIDKKAVSDGSPRVNLDARHPSTESGEQSRQPLQPHTPQTVGDPVMNDRMHSGIGRQNLKGITCCWVTFKDTRDVVSQLTDTQSCSPCLFWALSFDDAVR